MTIITKVCKKCGVERDRDLFNKKGKPHHSGSRVSTCRICQSKNGIVYSFYKFPTKEMNDIANKNRNRIFLKLRTEKNTIHKKTAIKRICLRCNIDVIPYNKKICTACRKKSDLLQKRISEKRGRIFLTDHYIKKQIKDSLKEYKINRIDVPQELIELKRKQLLLTRTIRNNGN
jgi:hypothetical protein